MAGLWYRAGTVTVTTGSAKIIGFGSVWKSGANKPDKGHTFWGPDGKHYELDYVESDTVLYLVKPYAGPTASGQYYEIDTTRTSTIPALSREVSALLAYAQGQYDGWQAVLTGSGDVLLTAPDGQQVTVPSLSNMLSKSGSLSGIKQPDVALGHLGLSAFAVELIKIADADQMAEKLDVYSKSYGDNKYVSLEDSQTITGVKYFKVGINLAADGVYVDPDANIVRDAKFGSKGIAVKGGIKADTLRLYGDLYVQGTDGHFIDPDVNVARDAKFGNHGIAVKGGTKTDTLEVTGTLKMSGFDNIEFIGPDDTGGILWKSPDGTLRLGISSKATGGADLNTNGGAININKVNRTGKITLDPEDLHVGANFCEFSNGESHFALGGYSDPAVGRAAAVKIGSGGLVVRGGIWSVDGQGASAQDVTRKDYVDGRTGSDVKLKSNITKLEHSLDKACALNGYSFDKIDWPLVDVHRKAGVIAQEVEAVLPEAIGWAGDEETGIKTVDPLALCGLLIEAVKELKSKVDDLEAIVAANGHTVSDGVTSEQLLPE